MAQQFDIGKYIYWVGINNIRILCRSAPSDLIDSIESYDRKLHQTLDKILSKRCSGSSSSSQIKKFRRDSEYNNDLKSAIKPILDQEPILSKHFSKEELEKLSLLWIAVLAGYEKSAELLVRSGADVNELFGCHDPQVIYEKWTILHVFVEMDSFPESERLIRLVIDHGANLQAQDHQGKTGLHHAASEDLVNIAEILLEKGADIDITDDEGKTPLLAAAESEGILMIQLLVKHGADLFVKDDLGQNALHYLVNWKGINAVDVARFFIKKGLSVNDEDFSHEQPIHEAAFDGNYTLVKLFLDHGANVNHRKEDGSTVLHDACMDAMISADIYTEDIEMNTAEKSIIELLLSAGADVLIEDHDGLTPFTLIVSGINVDNAGSRLMIKALVLKKAFQPSIELKDEKIIQKYPNLQNYYRECNEEIDRMKITKIIATCSFFELLTESHCRIAELMRNPEFESKFRVYLNGFSKFSEYLLRAFERAQRHYHAMLEQENAINEAVFDMLPYTVVRGIVHYITFNDCCSENVK